MNPGKNRFTLGLAASLLVASMVVADDYTPPKKPSAAEMNSVESPLEPLAFLVGGEWEAKLPVPPDGKQVSILAHFTWADNHKAIRISNCYAAGARTAPYIDGMYAWHPQKKAIIFWYVDAEGNFYEGTVKPDHDSLIHEFQLTDPQGAVTHFSAKQTREGTNAWVNEISELKDGQLHAEVTVRYVKKK